MDQSKKEILYSIGLGIALMLIALILESIIQSVPLIILIAKNGIKNVSTNFVNLELNYALIYSIFLGLVAGTSQEVFKYIGVDFKSREYAFWIGIGFSIVDISFLLIESLLTSSIVSREKSVAAILSIVPLSTILLNLFVSLLFHPGTAMMLKFGRMANKKISMLVTAITMHTIIDGGVDYVDIEVILNHFNLSFATHVFWTVSVTIALVSIILGSYLIRKVK